jgi:hypothetical protein
MAFPSELSERNPVYQSMTLMRLHYNFSCDKINHRYNDLQFGRLQWPKLAKWLGTTDMTLYVLSTNSMLPLVVTNR